MSKEELLKYLIAEIDLIMHDKDYRFENEDGTWYSRESCRNLTNEEVFEELRIELRQLSDLEAKLAESEKALEAKESVNQMYKATLSLKDSDFSDLVRENVKLKQQLKESEKKNFELIAKLNLKEHRPAFCTLADRECEALGKFEELKQQLDEKDEEVGKWKSMAERSSNLLDRYSRTGEIETQDKISFCIEQLENMKETTECVLDNALKNSSLNQSYYDRLLGEIDNQIKQLKEMK